MERSVASVVASLTRKHENLPLPSDTMMAQAAEATETVRTTPWRGSVDRAPAAVSAPANTYASFVRDEAMVMAPIMVQLLAALDPLPHIAAVLGSDEPKLRRANADIV